MTHRLPVLLLLASAVIALPERASAQEAAVTSLTPFCDTVTAIVPDDSASAFISEGAATSMQPAVFADAIVMPKSGTRPAVHPAGRACNGLHHRSPSRVHLACWRCTRDSRRCKLSMRTRRSRPRVRVTRSPTRSWLPFADAGCNVCLQGGNHDLDDSARGEAAQDTPRGRNRIDGRRQRRVRERGRLQLQPVEPLAWTPPE